MNLLAFLIDPHTELKPDDVAFDSTAYWLGEFICIYLKPVQETD